MLRDLLKTLTDLEVAELCRAIGAEVFHRNCYRWRALGMVADDLEAEAKCRADRTAARRLVAARRPAA